MRYDYIILGAGITGMCCAERLKKRDPKAKILIIEERPVTGGLSRSIPYKDWRLDLGPHRLYTPYPKVEEYWKQLLGDELLTVDRSSAMYLHGKMVEYPFQMSNLMLSLSPVKALQYLSSFVCQKLTHAHISMNNPAKALQEFSYTGYLRSRFGEMIARDVFYPYAYKVWGLPPENLSSWILKKRVSSPTLSAMISSLWNQKKKKEMVREDFYYPRLGMNQLIEAIEKQCRSNAITFSLNDRVKFLERKEQHWKVETIHEKYEAMRVISTLPVTEMMHLTQNRFIDGDKKLRQSFKSLSFRKIYMVYLFLSRPAEEFKSWYYFPQKDIIFSRISNLKRFSKNISDTEGTVLCCEIPMDMHENPHEEAGDFVIRDLERTGLLKREEVKEVYCHEEPFCYPVYDLIFEAKLKLIFQYLGRQTNLISTGRQGLFHHNNIDHAILMGWTTADYCYNSGFIMDLTRWYFQTTRSFEAFKIID